MQTMWDVHGVLTFFVTRTVYAASTQIARFLNSGIDISKMWDLQQKCDMNAHRNYNICGLHHRHSWRATFDGIFKPMCQW